MIHDNQLIKHHEEIFSAQASCVSHAPGRVNLIGEHTDYNGGFVMPVALNRDTAISASPSSNNRWHLHSINFAERVELTAEETQTKQKAHWVNYLLAVLDQFEKQGHAVEPMDLVIWGDVPLASGLSSSASVEVAFGTLLNRIADAKLSAASIAELCQLAENGPFIGVQCGIMDQFISAAGESQHCLLLDCNSLDYSLVPFNSSKATIVVIDTKKPRTLATSAYNERCRECAEGLESLSKAEGASYNQLRNVPLKVFNEHERHLSETIRKRVRHVLTENRRVHEFADALKTEDYERAGELLYQSHASLRNDYEVSCDELDAVVEVARGKSGIFGCRMTGAGFGGCAVALVQTGKEEELADRIAAEYKDATGLDPEIIISPPSEGARITHSSKTAVTN